MKESEYRNKIVVGDAFDLVHELPENSIDTIWSSPPYWGLRDYPNIGDAYKFGLEKTVEEYVESTVTLFDGFLDCLKPWGTVWWNVGDTYINSESQGFRCKNLAMIPFRVAIALQERGWYVRSLVSWVKKVALPDPTKDRMPNTWEPIMLLAHPECNGKYHFDIDKIRIPGPNALHPMGVPRKNYLRTGPHNHQAKGHFAAQSTEVVAKYLPATLPTKVCVENGKPIYDVMTAEKVDWGGDWQKMRDDAWRAKGRGAGNTGLRNVSRGDDREWKKITVNGDHNGETAKGIVLDPFMGSGTTAVVAKDIGADFVGFEGSPSNAGMAMDRVYSQPVSLFDGI